MIDIADDIYNKEYHTHYNADWSILFIETDQPLIMLFDSSIKDSLFKYNSYLPLLYGLRVVYIKKGVGRYIDQDKFINLLQKRCSDKIAEQDYLLKHFPLSMTKNI